MNDCPVCDKTLINKRNLVFCSSCSIFWGGRDNFYKISNFFKAPDFHQKSGVGSGFAEEMILAVVLFLFFSILAVFS